MKFVYFGYDFMLDTVYRLMDDGHELIGIFSFECDNIFNFNKECRELADKLDIAFTTQKALPIDIQVFVNQGAQVFFAAGYPHKIPPINEDEAYGINLHPSLLPQGRGIMPTPTIILKHPNVCGYTIHKLTKTFDDGDILVQKPIKITDQDDVETISSRIVIHAPDTLSKAFKNLPELWAHAIPQNKAHATTYPMPDDKMRLLDWTKPVFDIMKTGRAFGRFGCLANLNGKLFGVYNMNVWEEAHNHAPGQIINAQSRCITIAAANGFVCLKEFQELR